MQGRTMEGDQQCRAERWRVTNSEGQNGDFKVAPFKMLFLTFGGHMPRYSCTICLVCIPTSLYSFTDYLFDNS